MTQNPVAVITGASSGIGEIFAYELAKQGYDLILIARRRDFLEKVKETIITKNRVSVQIIQADLSKQDEVKHIAEQLENEAYLEILINNAGFGTTGKFASIPMDKPLSMVNLQTTATVILTHAALQPMLKNDKGYIINVASMAGFLYAAYNVTYTASKAFLITFSRSLQEEVAGNGIRVQVLCPGFTYSGFHDTPELQKIGRRGIPKWMWITSELVVETSLKNLNKNNVVVIPAWRYKLIKTFLLHNFLLWLGRFAAQWRRKREKKQN